ncbi:sigma-70 family RNA polymerase sigma factor [Streptomyces scopuliridis]|uniref:sigma-70 family RNA polymerase sigma factor n=1 Tax=Streptomyces scopuliridis TaxID=452529 RepID=UPI003685D245
MRSDGRDEPLRGGGTGGSTEGGTDPEGASVRQVPSQGGPKGAPELGASGGAGGSGDSGGSGSTEAESSVPPQRERSGGSSAEQPSEPVVDQPTLELSAAGRPMSDADLIQRMRDGDDHAYEELFRRHSESVCRYARTCCRDAHTAEDLTAEVFARTLQAVRGGAGPEQAVRAYLMTTVRRVAASWTKSAKREQLVEDFAVFAAQAARASEVSDADTLDLGADVLAMREAEQSMAMQAFRSLPERWQAVLWHTTVEEESPSEVAPLFGLTANATAVLASRAREGLKQAYLQAHVNSALTSAGDCSRYADRLGAYARGGLRTRAERGLRKHLDECVKCRLAAGELAQFNAEIPGVLPIAVIGWFAAGYSLKAAGIVAGGAAGAAGAGAAAAATGASGGAAAGASGGATGGTTGGAAASEGLGTPVKAGIGGLVAVAVAAGLVFALVNNSGPEQPPKAEPPVAQPLVPQKAAPSPGPPRPAAPEPPPPSPEPAPKPKPKPKPSATPSATPSEKPAPSPKPTPSRTPAPKPPSKPKPRPPAPPVPKPTPSPKPPPAPAVFQVNQLGYGVFGDGSEPEVRLGAGGWLWQRSSVSIGGTRYGHGVTMHAASSVTIDLNRSCSRYAALVGVDDLTMGLGSVRFSLYGDGTRLWRSPVLSGGDAAVPVDVGISGRKTIRLVVEPHTPFDVVALADWAQSRISCR